MVFIAWCLCQLSLPSYFDVAVTGLLFPKVAEANVPKTAVEIAGGPMAEAQRLGCCQASSAKTSCLAGPVVL